MELRRGDVLGVADRQAWRAWGAADGGGVNGGRYRWRPSAGGRAGAAARLREAGKPLF